MKQLTNNPNSDQKEQLWLLFAYCLKAFIPIVTQNYIDCFIRKNSSHPNELLTAMYNRVVFEQNSVMKPHDIRGMIQYFLKVILETLIRLKICLIWWIIVLNIHLKPIQISLLYCGMYKYSWDLIL